jgi:AmmeMemoRadiSam system protein A
MDTERPREASEPARLGRHERGIALTVARGAIRAAILGEPAPRLGPDVRSGALGETRGCFVTLEKAGQLRGCIGSLEPHRALIEDIAENARAAALRDPRFVPVAAHELDSLELSISVLGAPEPIHFASENDLLGQIRPGIDGLILRDGEHRATFLPAVWDRLTDPHRFLCELKRKAGLPLDHWSDTLLVYRYTTKSFR